MDQHLLLLSLAAFIVGMSKGGLASAGALAVPLLALSMDPLIAAALLLPIYIVSDLVGVWLYRREYSAPNLKILIPAGAIGILLGTLLAPLMPVAVFTLATGLIGLAYCLRAWVGKGRTAPPRSPRPLPGFFWGMLTGLTSFVSHSGSPPFQSYVMPQRLPKLVFAGTNTITFAVINLLKLPAYGALGLMDRLDPTLTGALCVAAIIGTFAGKRLAMALPDHVYLRLIEILLLILSLRLLWQGAAELI